jgi:hypothetical protein
VDTKQLVDELVGMTKSKKGKGVESSEMDVRHASKAVVQKMSEGVKGLGEKTGEKVGEWREVGEDAKNTMKKDFVERMQQVRLNLVFKSNISQLISLHSEDPRPSPIRPRIPKRSPRNPDPSPQICR